TKDCQPLRRDHARSEEAPGGQERTGPPHRRLVRLAGGLSGDGRFQDRGRAAVSPLRRCAEVKESQMTPRKKMRALIARQGYTMAPGAYDTLTARLVGPAGVEAGFLTGRRFSPADR